MQRYKQRYIHTCMHACIQTDRQADIQTDIHADRHTDIICVGLEFATGCAIKPPVFVMIPTRPYSSKNGIFQENYTVILYYPRITLG